MMFVVICTMLMGVVTVGGVGTVVMLAVKQMVRDILLKGGVLLMTLILGTGVFITFLFGAAVA